MRAPAFCLLPMAAVLAASACMQRPEPEPAPEPTPAPAVVIQAPSPSSAATPARETPPTPAPAPAPARAAEPAPPATPAEVTVGFVVTRNADTLASERYTRTASRVSGELLIAGAGIRQTYGMTLRPSGTVARFESAAYRVSAPTEPLQAVVARFDSTGAMIESGGQTTPLDAPAGTIPFINLSAAVIEQILLRAKAIGGPAADVPVLVMAGGQNTTAGVRWLGADSAVINLGPELRVHVSPTGELLGGVVPSQAVYFIRDGTAPRPTSRAPDYSAPSGAPYRAEEVKVRNAEAGISLAGTLTLPEVSSGTRVPAVVLITGSGLQDRDESAPGLRGWRPFRQIADTLGRRGIAVLRLDDRGIGGSDQGPPDATTMDFAGDIGAAVTYLRTRPEIDGARIALVGHSEGAQIAPIVAAEDPALRAIVMVAGPSRVGRRISDAQIAYAMDEAKITGARRDSLLEVNDAQRDSLASRNGWIRFWMTYDPLPVVRRVRAPVLILHGATDRQVTPDQADELAAALRSGGNRDVTVRVFPNMNHLLVEDPHGGYSGYTNLPSLEVRKDFLGVLADWLAAKLVRR